jgi:hypothetical protein
MVRYRYTQRRLTRLPALLFTRIVTVDDRALSLRIGPFRRRIPLAAIVSAIRVGETDAIELVLADRRIVRVGTDDPDALLAALDHAAARAPAAGDLPPSYRFAWVGLLMIAVACLLIAMLLTLVRSGVMRTSP